MGHLVGKEISVGFDLEDALGISRSFWSKNADFINSYSQENTAYQLQEKLIQTRKIDKNKRILQKDLKNAKKIMAKLHPETNQIKALPLGIFAWNRYDGKVLDKTPTSKKYKVAINWSKEYISSQNLDHNFDFITNSKRKAEKKLVELGFKAINRELEINRVNAEEISVFNYNRFFKKFPSESYFFKDRENSDFYILDKKNNIINQAKITFTQSKNKLNRLTSYNKLVLPMYAYALSFDAYIG